MAQVETVFQNVKGLLKNGVGWMAFCPAHDDGRKHGNRSLSITQKEGKILLHCFNGCGTDAIIGALGLEIGDLFSDPPKKPRRVEIVKKPITSKQIEQWWLPARSIAGTPVELYLRNRGITLSLDNFPSIRYLERAPYYEGKSKKPKGYYPCMVAAIANHDGDIIGIHRTYLTTDGRKAPIDSNKKMLGAVQGYGVRLNPRQPRIAIGEGIETVLSVATTEGIDRYQYIAALSAISLSGFIIPEWCESIDIYCDSDQTGLAEARNLAVKCKLAKKEVVIHEPPAGKDFNDLLREPAPVAIREIGEPTAAEIKSVTRARIPVNEVSDSTTQIAWDALRQFNDPPVIFRSPAGGMLRITGNVLEPLREMNFWNFLNRMAVWEKDTPQGVARVLANKDICTDMFYEANPPLPVLNRVVSHWLIDKDGRLLTKAGYDEPSGIYLTEDFKPSDLPLDSAIGIFDELLCDFKWAARSDRAHAFALLLLPFVREYIWGPTPLHLFEAPTPGTGKGLLAQTLLCPSVALNHGLVIPSNDTDRLSRQIESMLMSRKEVAIIDNIDREFDSGAIAALITAPVNVDIRPLYSNQTVSIRQRLIWVATVNNPAISDDLHRRSLRIRILAPIERPYLREDIKDEDLLHTMEERRGETSAAAMAIIGAWIAADRPRKDLKFGSFANWAKTMGGILDVAGIAGFLEKQEEEMVDVNRETFLKFLDEWFEYQQDWAPGVDLVRHAIAAGLFLGKRDDPKAQNWVLARKLSEYKDRIVGRFKVESRILTGKTLWRLSVIKDDKDGELPF